MDLQTFTELYHEYRRSKWPEGHSPPYIKFSLEKTRVLKKRQDTYVADENRVPKLVSSVPAVSKRVFDTNGACKLYAAMWEYYLGSQLKRISSEGNYRPGIGFIKSGNKGISDLLGIHKGVVYFIEAKQPKEKHLDSQVKFKDWVEKGDGTYVTVRGFEDMYNLIQKIINS